MSSLRLLKFFIIGNERNDDLSIELFDSTSYNDYSKSLFPPYITINNGFYVDWDSIESICNVFLKIKDFYLKHKDRDFLDCDVRCNECGRVFKKGDLKWISQQSDHVDCPFCDNEDDFSFVGLIKNFKKQDLNNGKYVVNYFMNKEKNENIIINLVKQFCDLGEEYEESCDNLHLKLGNMLGLKILRLTLTKTLNDNFNICKKRFKNGNVYKGIKLKSFFDVNESLEYTFVENITLNELKYKYNYQDTDFIIISERDYVLFAIDGKRILKYINTHILSDFNFRVDYIFQIKEQKNLYAWVLPIPKDFKRNKYPVVKANDKKEKVLFNLRDFIIDKISKGWGKTITYEEYIKRFK